MKRTPLKIGISQLKRSGWKRKLVKVERQKVKVKSKKTTAQLKKELDKVFSLFIRQKYADSNSSGRCYTCGISKHWKELHCGHFISRSYLATRFSEDNVRPQCAGCNIFGGGRTVQFAANLERDYGEGIVQRLYKEAQEIIKNYPYEQKINEYTAKIKLLI